MDGATGRQAALGPSALPRETPASWTRESEDYSVSVRTREQSAARPLSHLPGTFKLPTIPRAVYPESSYADEVDRNQRSADELEWDGDWDGGDSIPDLAAFRPLIQGVKPRRRVNTQMLIERARSPWSIARTILAALVMVVALFATINGMGEPPQNLMQTAFASSAGSLSAPSVAGRVQPETQLLRPDLYDNYAQFQAWGDADCSAATASEVLTAWGIHGATIGKLIDAMQPDISLNGGLLHITGYQRGVSAFGYHADISDHLTYNQMVYITHTLGLPVIVNVRVSYGYFHFFSGGHFLVMTDGDSQGLKIVDSSEYYITYLPRDVFYSMFTGITVVIVPDGYSYAIPNI